MRKRSVGGLSVPRGSRGSGLTGCSQQRTDTDRVAVRRGAVCLGCTSRREEGRWRRGGGGLWRLRGDNAGYVCAARETGLGVGSLVCRFNAASTLQNSRAFCRPDSGYHQHKLLTRSKVKSWRQRAAQGKAPSTGVRGLGCSCTRYWQASVPISVRCRPTRPDGCCSSVPRDNPQRAAGSSYPPPRGLAWRLFSSKEDKRGSEPMAFGSAAWRCGLQTLHAVVSETGSESGLGKRVHRDPATWAQENPPVVTVTATGCQ